MIDYFADDSKMCEVKDLHCVTKKFKRDWNAASVEKTEWNENKKRLERETKAEKESIENALGLRSDGKGADLDFCLSNISDAKLSGIFNGLRELGKAAGSHGKFMLVPSMQS